MGTAEENTNRDEPHYFIPAMNFFNFGRPSQPGAAWHPAGLASVLPDLSLDNDDCQITQACKAFTIPKTAGSQDAPVEADINLPGEDLKDQVLVFKYKGKVHAIDHVSGPGAGLPISKLTLSAMPSPIVPPFKG